MAKNADSTTDDGFLRTIVDYLVRNDGKWVGIAPAVFEQTEIAQHVTACGVAEVFNVDQRNEVAIKRQDYRGTEHEGVSYFSANFRCNCGTYALINIRQRATLGGIMYDIEQRRRAQA